MPFSRVRPPLDVLLVEDNAADVRLAREAIGHGPEAPRLHVVPDGEAAIQFLRKLPPHELVPSPALVLLDLNLPRRDGREVLADIKSDPVLRAIPVIVFTTSRYVGDVQEAYRLGANAYVAKPFRFEEFCQALNGIALYWLRVVTLPTFESSGHRGAAAEPGA